MNRAKSVIAILLFTPISMSIHGEPSAVDVVGHMHEHLTAITTIKDAVIRGDLKATREPARWLAGHQAPDNVPEQWSGSIEAMRTAARTAVEAQDLEAAAGAAAAMASACADCHRANNISGQFSRHTEPGDEDGLASHMQRHQWAADRMWEGLIGPSNEAWNQGIDLLLEAPLSTHELSDDDSDYGRTRNLSRRVHQLAAHGMMEQDPNRRAGIYADFLAACAACHTTLGAGPR